MSDNPEIRHTRLRQWGLVGLFLLAFLPRALYPVSRALQWYFRSGEFFQAVLHGDWSGTLLSEHPGVPVMWLSGATLWAWHGLRSLIGLNPPTPLETEGYAFFDQVAVGVLPLALVVALGIVWGWKLLRRLWGERVAWVTASLWALDPFFLANSKTLHLDALLSVLMVLTALWLLLYLREREERQLVLSGILGGLAILTKITAVFLVPFVGVALFLSLTRDNDGKGNDISLGLGSISQHLMRPLFVWLIVALGLAVVLWPSLWVQPQESIRFIIEEGILTKVNPTHALPRFYRGDILVGDPGMTYYLDTLLFRTTFVTLPFAILGLGRGLLRRQGRGSKVLLAVFALLYFTQMILGGRKEERYMLPVLLVIDAFAALGIVWLVDHVLTNPRGRIALTAVLVSAQACLVLARHPYYGTHYNGLLGGAQTASRVLPLAEFGEGLDLAGQYIEDQLAGEDGTVATQFLANEMVVQHVRAPVYDFAQVGQDADYLVFGTQYTTRGGAYPRWGALWEQTYKFREPAFAVRFAGLPYAWVHRPGADPMVPQPVDAQLGESVEFVGYRLAESRVAPGESLLLTLYWQATAPVDGAFKVFAHIRGPGEQLMAQRDSVPGRGTQPTTSWSPGVLIEDPYVIEIPNSAASGNYEIHVGMYDPTTMERLPARNAEGTRVLDDSLFLTQVRIRPRVPSWRWALSAIWLASIAAVAGHATLSSMNQDTKKSS